MAQKKKQDDLDWLPEKRRDLGLSANLEAGKVGKYVAHAMSGIRYAPPDLNDISTIRNTADKYLLDCIDLDIVPTVTGLCRRLGITKATFSGWRNGRARNADYQMFAEQYYAMLEEIIVDLSLDNKVNNIATIVQLKNHFGYVDEQKVVLEPKSPVIDESFTMADVLEIAGAETPKIAEFSEIPVDNKAQKE